MTYREARQKAGLTLKQVADAVGVAESTVCYWELGLRTPTLGHLKSMAGVLNVPVQELIS